MLRKLVAYTRSKVEPDTHSISEGWEVIACSVEPDAVALAQEAVRAGLIPQDVLDHLTSLHPEVPNSIKLRYLLTQIHSATKDKEGLFLRMVQLFLKFRSNPEPTASTISTGNPMISDQLLVPGHISDLIELLTSYAHKWRLIGTALRFKPQDLDNIQVNHASMVDSLRLNLIKLLTDWLEKKHKHTKPPTVETLEAALSSCTVGLGNVADDVRRYITLVPHDIDLESSPPYLEIHIDLSIDRPYDELTDYDYDCIEPCDNGNTNFRTTCSTNMPSSSLYVEENRPVLLEINAISGIDGSLNYQWLRGDQVLNNNNDYSGTTGPLLCITKAEIEMDGHEFFCRITTSGLQQAIVTTPV